MKTKRIFSIIAAATLAISAGAQYSAHDNYVGASFGGGLNTLLYQPANGTSKVGAGFDASLFYGRFFNPWIGLGVGLNYSWANAYATYNWNEVTTGLTHVSNPNVPYDLTTGFNNFVERQNVGILSIPVELLFRKSFNDRWSLIGGVGLSIDFPIHGAYYAKGGSYSTTGVFPSIGNYTVQDMPEHGFSTYTTTQGAKINNSAKVGVGILGDLGARVALNNNWGLYLGVYVGYGCTNLLAQAKTEEMIMINATDPSKIDYRGTFDSNEASKANHLRCGVKIAIDFGWPAVDKKKLEEERLAREQFIADSIANEQRLAREKAIADSIAAAEQARLAAEEAARLAREKAIADSIAAAEAEKAEVKRMVESINIHFENSGHSFTFKDEEKEIVDRLCAMMKEDPSIRICITGHTDSYGDPEQNLRYYGKKRAEALKMYMVDNGVDEAQIECVSKGQTEPVAPNDTRANRALNRRANIKFL